MADTVVFEESSTIESPSTPFVDRDWGYVLDQQQGSYAGGQVTFDTSSIASQDRFTNWKEAYVTIPVVLSLNSSNATSIAASTIPFGAALKSGFWQLVHSFSVEVGGRTVVQLTPFQNIYTTFKCLSEWSEDDMAKWGPALGFAKDSNLSWRWVAQGTQDANGDGISNNQNYVNLSTLNGAAPQDIGNAGLYTRQREASMDHSQAPFSTFMTQAQASTAGKASHAGNTANNFRLWHYLAKIRLADLSPFFSELPISKGVSMRLTFNLNTGSVQINKGGAATMALNPAGTNITGGTFPAMISSMTASNGLAGIQAATDTTMILNVSVGRVANSALAANGQAHPIYQTCRVYCPFYQFNPDHLTQYLSLGSKRKVNFSDILFFRVNSIGAGQTFNSLVSNGIVNPQRILVVPYWPGTAYSQLVSPFDSAPATTMPLASITNFNVMVSGQNVLNQNIVYDAEAFMHELVSTGINGAMSTGLASGLLTQLDFQTLYRYYLVNLSRRLPNEDGTPKSIQILGTNNTPQTMDLFVFVEYSRTNTVDVVTGQFE